MPGRGSGSSDTSSSSVPEQQEARYRGLEWRTASKKGERDMRERWMDHRSRSLAVLLVVLIVAMVPAGAVQSQDKKPIVIAVPGGPSGVNSVVAPAVVQSGQLPVEGIHAQGGGPGRKLPPLPTHHQDRAARPLEA